MYSDIQATTRSEDKSDPCEVKLKQGSETQTGERKIKMKMTTSNGIRLSIVCAIVAVTAVATMSIAEEASSGLSSSKVAGESEIKVAPGAIHVVWKGKELSEPEIAAMVDKQKVFDMNNESRDPSVKAVGNRTSRWTGILNVDEPAVYTFNVVYRGRSNDSTMSLSINGVHVIGFSGSGTGSKNVQLPGSANIEMTLYSSSAHMGNNVLIRYKKAGTLDYTTIAPETLYHAVK